MKEDIVLEARHTWWEIVDSDGGECRLMGIVRELADEVERLRGKAVKEYGYAEIDRFVKGCIRMTYTHPIVVLQARSPEIAELVKQCAAGLLPFDALSEKVAAMGFKTTSLHEMVRQEEAKMAKDIEIVEPTEEERRNILNTARPLTRNQQETITRLEECMREVAELKPGDASSDVNPVFRHPYQRAAVRALELAHSECLNWFDRLNRGFTLSTRDIKPPPEKQE